MRWLNFDLLVEQITADRQSGWLPRHRARVWSSPAGQSRAWEFRWEYVEGEVSRYLELGRAGWAPSIENRYTDPRIAKLETFGALLFERVLGETGKQLLARSRDLARRENLPLRIRVRLDGLADLPWECLHDGDQFLCLSADTPLVRCLAVDKPVNPEPVTGPLRVLAVIASPSNPRVDHIDAERAWAEIVSALHDAEGVQLDRLARPTYAELRRKLQSGPYHVLHLVGHGRFNPLPGGAIGSGRGEGALLLEDSDGKPEWVPASKLAQMLTEHRPLRLVVLNACESAATDSADPFTGVAQRLLRLRAPAVVAMQAAISQRAAAVFSGRLYQQLADGAALDAAVTAARQAIHDDERHLEWLTPVVFANPTDSDVCVFTPSEPAAVRVPESPSGRTGAPPITESQRAARDQVLAGAAGGEGFRAALRADSGCGKTWLLGTLANDLAELGYAALFITAPRPGDAVAGTDRSAQDVAVCEALIARMADDITPSATLVDEVAADIADQVRAAAAAGLSQDTGDAANAASPRNHRKARMQAMGAGLVDALRKLATESPIAILVDDLQELGPGPGKWLQGVFAELPGALIVCAHQSSVEGPEWTRLELTAMTTEEAQRYVLANLPGWTPEQARAVTALITAPRNYPVWIATWCQMIRQAIEPGASTEQINRYISAVPAGYDDGDRGHTELLAERISRFKAFVDDYAERIVGIRIPLFDQLTVLTRVTAAKTRSAKTMLAVLFPRLEDIEADTLYRWLANSQFMTRFGDDPSAGVRMHDLLRKSAEDLLSGAHDPRQRETYRKLQRNAERYYREMLHFEDDLDEDSRWSAWSRYEDPVFRRNCRDWLHHAARVEAVDFLDTERAFVRLWLEVFWWWDADVPTDFCRQLLTDYRVLCDVRRSWNLGADDRKLKCLEAFYQGYVSDWRERKPGRHSERWQSAREALETLWDLFGFDTDAVPEDWVQRRSYILLAVFRGDAVRYGGALTDERLAVADDWYRVAADACKEEDDTWVRHWIVFYNADMWVDDDRARAKQLVDGLSDLIDDEDAPDHELRVHLTRLYGDLAWWEKDYSRALDVYARACLHGYVFQIRQEVMQTPNEYSLNVYEKMLATADHRLAEARLLVRDGCVEPGLADDALARWHQLFAPYWEAGSSDEAETDSGFPSPPKRDELNKLGTRYYAAVKWTLRHMEDQLEHRPLMEHLRLP
jgi:hypothetical protein